MANYEGPICPPILDTIQSLKDDEDEMSGYSSNFKYTIEDNDTVSDYTILLFSKNASDIYDDGSDSEKDAISTLYEQIFYSTLRPSLTIPKIADPENEEKTYKSAIEELDGDPESASMSVAKVSLSQALAVYRAINPTS